MDFSAHLQGICPVHFSLNADDMTFFNNDGDQIQWGGFDMEQAPDQLICLGAEYPGHDDVDLDHAGELAITETTAQHLLAQSTPTAGAASNSLNSPGSHEALGSASADPAASQTPSLKRLTCNDCGSISAKTARDFKRHLATAKHRKNAIRNGREETLLEPSTNPGTGFRCPVPPCDKVFPRKDNLWRHIAKMHGISDREA